MAIVGPSGSGKSTLLNLLGTLDTPDQGTVVIDGMDLSRMAGDALATFRNANIGFVFQSHHLLPHLTVLENVLVPVLARESRIGPEVLARAGVLLERVGLTPRQGQLPGRLSGGNVNAPPSSGPSSTAPSCCSPTNPPGRSIAPPPATLPRCWAS